MADHTIGVDISKSHLDAFRLEDRAAQRFEISAAGFRALRKWLDTAPVARVVFEPTGPYHKAFEAALGETFPLVKVPLSAISPRALSAASSSVPRSAGTLASVRRSRDA